MTTQRPSVSALSKVLRLNVIAFGAVRVVVIHVAGVRLDRMPGGFFSHIFTLH
jgi:hypothetical protein